MIDTASNAFGFLSGLREGELAEWLRRALAGDCAPLAAFAPGDPPGAELALIPRSLPVPAAARFQSALALLLKGLADQPGNWPINDAEELLALADLLGTRALPGCEPWELGLAFSLKPLIESRPIVFDGLPAQLRLRMLALLGANPCTLSGEFWERLYHRRPEYQSPAWRGMLRVDWDRACAHLADFPHDDSALRSLRHHARFALQRIQKDETGHLRIGFSRAIRTAHPAVRTVIEEEARKMGVSLAQSGLGLNRPLVDWVCYWLDLEPDPDEAAPVRDANGTTVDDQCLANLVGILEKVEEFDKPVATKINDGVAIDFSIKEAFGVAENSLRYHYGEGTRELELLEMARARPLQDGETIARARALQESEMAESEPSI